LSSNEKAIVTGKYFTKKLLLTVTSKNRLVEWPVLEVFPDYRKAAGKYGYCRYNKPYDQNWDNAGNCDFHHPRLLFYSSLLCSVNLLQVTIFGVLQTEEPTLKSIPVKRLRSKAR